MYNPEDFLRKSTRKKILSHVADTLLTISLETNPCCGMEKAAELYIAVINQELGQKIVDQAKNHFIRGVKA